MFGDSGGGFVEQTTVLLGEFCTIDSPPVGARETTHR